jgi:hypothetical protein
MTEKYYTLSTYNTDQYIEIHNELCTSEITPDTIPDRECICTNDFEHSPTRGEFLLTDEEAQLLSTDSRIKLINKSPDKYPDEFMPPWEDLHCATTGVLTDRWSNPYFNYQIWYESSVNPEFNVREPTINRNSSQLYRMLTKQNPWKTNSTNDTIPISAKIQQKGAGENVDIICADNATWIGHTEFINRDVPNAVNPDDYIGGNVLPGDGYCDCLDVVLDSPYYIDPDWFDADPANRLTTRWDGTIVPTETAAHNWWRNSTQRSAQFAEFGNILVSTLYTRDTANGSNTTYPTPGTHGTQCASLIFGRTHGWAYNANKWILNLYGSNNVGSFDLGFDVQKIFHQYKPVNPIYGTKDPTMSSNSWGFRASNKSGTHYYFRDSGPVSYSGSLNEPGFISWLGATGDGGRWKSEMYDNSMTQAGDELTQAGVIFVAAAGNSNQPQYNPDHPNYDNRISNNDTNTFYQDNFAEFGYTVTGSTNRRGFPQHIGKTESQSFQGNTTVKFPAINVGALDDQMQGAFDKELKVNYSDTGNAIDIYAPADGTLAATAGTYGSDVARLDDSYPDLTVIAGCRDTRFGGTSAACPVACGMLAIVMQYNRDWSYDDLRNWIQTNVEVQPFADMYQGTEVTSATASWSADYNSLQGGEPRILYQATIPVTTPYPGDPEITTTSIIQGTFIFSGGLGLTRV